MRNVVTVHECHYHCDGNAVVGAEARSVSPNVLAVGLEPETVPLKVNVGFGGLDCDHIHVSLEYDGLMRFVSGSRRLSDYYVADLVLNIVKTTLGGKFAAKRTDLIRVVRTVRNGGDQFKKLKNLFGLQFTNIHNNTSFPF